MGVGYLKMGAHAQRHVVTQKLIILLQKCADRQVMGPVAIGVWPLRGIWKVGSKTPCCPPNEFVTCFFFGFLSPLRSKGFYSLLLDMQQNTMHALAHRLPMLLNSIFCRVGRCCVKRHVAL